MEALPLVPGPDQTPSPVPLSRSLVVTPEVARTGRRDLHRLWFPRLLGSLGGGLVVASALVGLWALASGRTSDVLRAGAWGALGLLGYAIVLWRQNSTRASAYFQAGFAFALGLDSGRLTVRTPVGLVTLPLVDLGRPRVLRSIVAIPLSRGRGHVVVPGDLVGDVMPTLVASIEGAATAARPTANVDQSARSTGWPASPVSSPVERVLVLTPQVRVEMKRRMLRFWLSHLSVWGVALSGVALGVVGAVSHDWATAALGVVLFALPAWTIATALRSNRRNLRRWPDGSLIGYRLTDDGLGCLVGDEQSLVDYSKVRSVRTRSGMVMVRTATGGRLVALVEHLPPDAVPLLSRYAAWNRGGRG